MRREEARILSIAIRRLTSRIRSVLELKELREYRLKTFHRICLRHEEDKDPIGSTYPATPLSALAVPVRSVFKSAKERPRRDRRDCVAPVGRNSCSPIDGSTPSRATYVRPHQISLTDTQLLDLPRSQKASGITMFCGDAHLPRDAARIPAAQYGPDLSWPM